MEGVSIVEESGRVVPNKLAWLASEALYEKQDYSLALKYIDGRSVIDYRGLDVCLKLMYTYWMHLQICRDRKSVV